MRDPSKAVMKTIGPSGLHERIYCFSCNAFTAELGEETPLLKTY